MDLKRIIYLLHVATILKQIPDANKQATVGNQDSN